MIPKYFQNGAAIGIVVAETVGPLIMLFFTRKHIKKISFFSKKRLKYFVATFIISLIIIYVKKIEFSSLETIICSFILGGIVYIGVLLLLKEEICVEGIKIIKNKVKK